MVGGNARDMPRSHDDAYASGQVYAEAEQGWWCLAASAAGGSTTWRRCSRARPGAADPRGEAFRAARELVEAGVG
jgi:hypothetical protein